MSELKLRPPEVRSSSALPSTILLRWLSRIVRRLRGTGKRPLSHYVGPNEKCGNAENNLQQAPLARRAGLPEEPPPTEHGEHGRQRVEPHLEREFVRAPAVVQEHDSDSLANKLDNQAHGQNSRDGRFQLQRNAEGKRQRSQDEKRDMRKMFRRMHLGEDGEEVTVKRRGVGHTGITEKKREDGSQGDPQHHSCEKKSGPLAIESFDEEASDEGRILSDAPGHHAEKARLHGEIQHGDAQDGEKNAARNVLFGVSDFAAEMADVVVAPVAVDSVDHGSAESREPHAGEMKRAGRK